MANLDFLSLGIGLTIGLVIVVLVWLREQKSSEESRNQTGQFQIKLGYLEKSLQQSENEKQELKEKLDKLLKEIQDYIAERATLINTRNHFEELLLKSGQEFDLLKEKLDLQLKQINDLAQRKVEIESQNQFLLEKLQGQKQEFEELRKQSQLEFQNLANKILEEKSQKFTLSNKENIDNILKPLGQNLEQFKKKVEETYDKESKQRFSLEERVKELVEMNQKLSAEAHNLATALKGQSKKQGNWGEIILESILEKSGLVKNREYKIQQSLVNEEGRRLQPDVIVFLPEDRSVVIDSKVSLVAYDRFTSADQKEVQDQALKDHIGSVYKHVDELSSKQYETVAGTMDFTMMFIPIEPAYILAIQEDQDLWAYAYARRVLLISPTNLIAALKLIADLWKREQQSKNAQEIAQQGEKLYDKIVGFLDSMEDVGRHINRTQDSYFKALGQLKDGRGSVIKQAQKLKQLGLKSEKEIPDTLIPQDSSSDEQEEDQD